ncbi:hypothetical protein DQP57_00465 [Mycobacterium colombiense]|uniref:Uncharacterized protein n=1 Tax=Mycobacterium colombiense TaxID=339268 RepID=A0A329MD73_9MYCO|nr:hypothetical protein [Mycobacterium colombiense]RAV17532.1 hypothetical protein DQP57_00465 [Mycobacterium colombiense]
MPRTNQDGKDVKLVLEWLCQRRLTDSELALALDIPPTNYSRRKDADDFPSFEELDQFGNHFNLSARALQIAFGYLDTDVLQLLDEDGLRQYVEQGGGVPPVFPTRRPGTTTIAIPRTKMLSRRKRKAGAPPP